MKARTARNRVALILTTLGVIIMVLALFGPQLRSAVAIIWEFGDVFAGVSGGNYKVYSKAGDFKQTIYNSYGGYTTGCAFNSSGTQLYTTNFSGGGVVKFADADPHDSSSFSTTGQSEPESFAFKKNGGYFVGGPGAAAILEFDASDNLIATHQVAGTDYTGGTDWIDVAANQTTIFYTGEGRLIKRFDTVIGQLSDFATLPGSGRAYAFRLLPPFDGSGGLIVADNGNVKRLDSGGNVIQTYSVSGVSDFFALNLDPDGQTFWTGSISNGNLYRFDIANGGADNYIQTISTGANGYLFGVCLKGEITGGIGACIQPPPNMVAWFPGDDDARDIWGGVNGTLQNGAAFADGKVGRAFNFDGTTNGQGVLLGNPAELQLEDFTIDAWVQRSRLDIAGNGPSNEGAILAYGHDGYGFGIFPDGRLLLTKVDEDSVDSGSSLKVSDTNFHHVAVTKTGGTVIFYIDGVAGTPINYDASFAFTKNVSIGARLDLSAPTSTSLSATFAGIIDEVEVFSRALTGDEISLISKAGSFGKCKPVCISPPDGLVAWYSGDGNAANIRTGTNNGTLENGATFAPGFVDQAFSLDGSNDYVRISDDGALDFEASDFSIDAWIKTTGEGAQMIYASAWNFNPTAQIELDGAGFAEFFIRDNNGNGIDVHGTTALNDGKWHHVAGVRSGTTAHVYVDGVEENSLTNGDLGTISLTCGFATIGGRRTDGPCAEPANESFFNGLIDEVEIFNRALGADAIMSIYAAHTAGKCKPQQSDVNDAFVNKNETFVQTSTADPTPENGTPFQLVVAVDATAPNNITSASFTPPGGSATALTSGNGTTFNFFSANFGDLTSFNAAYPNGDYAFDIHIAHAPFELTPIITLAGDSYPDIPKILNTNWSSNALEIDQPDQDFTFEWSPFCASCVSRPTGAPGIKWSGPVTQTSYITLSIVDDSDNVVLVQNLSSQETSFVMPANTLQVGRTYHAQLQYASLEDRNENGVQLSAQYATVTKFDIITAPPRPPAVCFNGHTYMLTDVAETWTQAESEAVSKGGHLVAISSATEQNFLVNHFLVDDFLLLPLWIGLTDRQKEGVFVWTTLTTVGRRIKNLPLTYTNWNASTHEPNDCCNNKVKHEEDYVAMNWHYSRNLTDPIGTWNDVPNGGTLLDGHSHGPYFGIIEVPNCSNP